MSLQPFTQVSGLAAPLLAANVDTDVIMPKQFLKGIDRNGLDRGVFFDLRFLAGRRTRPEFVLNQPAWQGANFLVVGPNFGCGSSREHAVWGLKQTGHPRVDRHDVCRDLLRQLPAQRRVVDHSGRSAGLAHRAACR